MHKALLLSTFLVVPTMLADHVSAGEISGTEFAHGAWEGLGYFNDETGKFSHCVVSAVFNSGDTLYLSVTNGATVVVGFSNPAFRFGEGESFPVSVHVDRRSPFYARATAVDGSTAFLELEDFDAALDAIQKGLNMQVRSDRIVGGYSLKGTNGALDKALQCAFDNLEYTHNSSTDAPQYSNVDKTILYQFATQMISEISALDFRYLTNEELVELGWENGVFWYSEELDVLGGTLVANGGGDNLRMTDPEDIGYLSGLCQGDFASKAVDVTSSDIEQRQVTGICINGDDRTEYIALKTSMGPDSLYNIFMFGPDSGSEQAQRQEVADGVAIYAAGFAEEQ